MESEDKKSMRNSNFELLRIISMFMIIAHHIQQKTVVTDTPLYKLLLKIVGLGSGIVGVTCFAMISAWFLWEDLSMKKSLYKAAAVLVQTLEYLLLFLFAGAINAAVSGRYQVENYVFATLADGLKSPLWMKRYWFVTTYIFLLLIAPVLNTMLQAISREQHKKLLFISGFVMAAAPFSDRENNYMKDLFLFVFIYVLTIYIKKYKRKYSQGKVLCMGLALKLVVVVGRGLSTFQFLPIWTKDFLLATFGYAGRYSLLLVLSGMCVFMFFAVLDIGKIKWLNRIASLTLGVYLFHENPVVNVTGIMYDLNPFPDVGRRFCFSLMLIFLLFAGGCLVEWVRQMSIGRLDGKVREAIGNLGR